MRFHGVALCCVSCCHLRVHHLIRHGTADGLGGQPLLDKQQVFRERDVSRH